VVFDGLPTTILDGLFVLGDPLLFQQNLLSGLCQDADRIVLLYFEPADRASETLWYTLQEFSPGWKAVLGTQGLVNTWRLVTENSIIGTETYSNLDIGGTCTVPSAWAQD
jgi:hypothetical protein